MNFASFHFSNALIAFICSINFMFLCSYCATLSKLATDFRLGETTCGSDKDCSSNAYCMDNRRCKCKDNFVQDSSTISCFPKSKKLNDSCNIDIQCTSTFGTHAHCFMNTSSGAGQCRCLTNSHFQDGLCYESVRLGGTCKVSDNCISTSNVPTYCAYSVCICTANYHPSSDRLDCLPDVALGKGCRKDEDCIADHSYCSNVCTCETGYVSSLDGTTCLPVAKSLRAQCVEDSQCHKYLQNTYCDTQDNICKCIPFSHELDKSCWISARLGEACTHPFQCVTPSLNRSVVTCSKGVCACADGYSRVDAECSKLKDVPAESSPLEKCLFLTIAAVLLSLPSD
ncbi:prion-like-(Q/N-rich) domain-bearing protein 25 isoform X1 [Homalodisca vitripennis]|uniref:prion-like-(Q/N-rich) domain-bearing protein 25 isoform X1 n=2 Tax=Homalodisca vitripennis TaxID=197043 RepID=UPI001EEC3541|nr:prion-like-(Q/N-rich) domain-bearing protein 25 isoform X1 [Homalodisca vitripennis]